MGKVVFLQRLWQEQLGVELLGAVLKQKGHLVEVFIGKGGAGMMKAVADVNPTLIAFSTTTGDHMWAATMAVRCKERLPEVPVVVGGPHATFFPQFIHKPGIDFLCRGEGEGALLDLLEALESGNDTTSIPNIWAKRDDTVYQNDLRPYVEPLDALPFADRSLYYDKYPFFREDGVYSVMLSRGCPMKCSYCFNAAWHDLYNGKGHHVRLRSVVHAIGELALIKREHTPRIIYFVDDLFGADISWTRAFLDRYEKEVGIPFVCNTHLRFITEEWAEMLGGSKCQCVQFGIESGNPEIRERVLGRRYSNEDIIQVAERLHRHGLQFMTYNILGSPGETIEQAFETVDLNTRIKTDYFIFSLCQPYPQTPLYEYAVACGFIKETDIDSFPASGLFDSLLKHPGMRRARNLQRLHLLAVRCPRLRFLVRWLIEMPPNPLFDVIYLASLVAPYARRTNRGFVRTFQLGLRNLSFWLS